MGGIHESNNNNNNDDEEEKEEEEDINNNVNDNDNKVVTNLKKRTNQELPRITMLMNSWANINFKDADFHVPFKSSPEANFKTPNGEAVNGISSKFFYRYHPCECTRHSMEIDAQYNTNSFGLLTWRD